jgi:DNA-binding SARP family transcriptional activator
MSDLRVSLFGKFRVELGPQTQPGFDSRKVQELFCYLLLYRDRPHPREALADLLWCGSSTNRPGRCLRKTLWQLRAALNDEDESLGGQVLLAERDWIQVNPNADLWLDVAVFEQAFNRLRRLPSDEPDLDGARELQSAVDLYQGGLQESWYEDWYLYERERFQHMYLSMLDRLMEHNEAQGRYEAGLVWGTRILSCEPARERTYRRLMRLYYLAGDRTAALRQYQHCVCALREELGVGPAGRTIALYQQIQTDSFSDTAPGQVELIQAHRAKDEPLPLVLRNLSRLQAMLGQVQQEMHRNIQALELAMHDHD